MAHVAADGTGTDSLPGFIKIFYTGFASMRLITSEMFIAMYWQFLRYYASSTNNQNILAVPWLWPVAWSTHYQIEQHRAIVTT